jgi:hypothetical protein
LTYRLGLYGCSYLIIDYRCAYRRSTLLWHGTRVSFVLLLHMECFVEPSSELRHGSLLSLMAMIPRTSCYKLCWISTSTFNHLSAIAHASSPKVHYNAYTTAETAEPVSCTGVVKGNMHLDKNFFRSVSVGCLLSLACATFISTVSLLDIKKRAWFDSHAFCARLSVQAVSGLPHGR